MQSLGTLTEELPKLNGYLPILSVENLTQKELVLRIKEHVKGAVRLVTFTLDARSAHRQLTDLINITF